ncbi:MAG TPA: tetratricopeptide repeat protein [Opitutaceae bacterium]|nr:tetratricopeptide repeat protein [Opitutaceae bacterium]
MNASRPTRSTPALPWLPLAVAALILAAVVWTYRGVGAVPFYFDDVPAIERNETIRQVWPPGPMLNPPETAAGATGRPVVNVSLALNYAVGGLEPRGYHWTNVGLHAAVALVLFGLVRRTLLLPTSSPDLASAALPISAIATIIWAVHPLLTESVVCVVQRNEVIVGLFYLLTLYGLVRSATSRYPNIWNTVAVTACALGMASKEVMVTAPVVALLYDRTFLAGSFGRAWKERRWVYVSLVATWGILVLLISQHHQRAGTVGFGLGVSSWDYLVAQARAVATYLKLAFWPHPLILDYGPDLFPIAQVWWQGLIVLALLAASAWALVRKPVAGFLAAAFFVVLSPSSSFVPLTTQPIAEHRMYLPLAAVMVLLIAVIWRQGSVLRYLVVVGLAAAYASLTVSRVEVYADDEKLWMDNVAKTPGNARAHASLGAVYARRGIWKEALPQLAEAVRLRPDYADARSDYATALMQSGRSEEAVRELTAARQLKPKDADIQYNLGVALAQAGRTAESTSEFREAARKSPRRVEAWNNLGDALLRQGQLTEALEAFQKVLSLDPDSAAAHNNAGVVLMRMGRPAEAVPHYQATLRQHPGLAMVHHNLALALAQSGKISEAIAHDEEAIRLQPDFTAAREQLERLRQDR